VKEESKEAFNGYGDLKEFKEEQPASVIGSGWNQSHV